MGEALGKPCLGVQLALGPAAPGASSMGPEGHVTMAASRCQYVELPKAVRQNTGMSDGLSRREGAMRPRSWRRFSDEASQSGEWAPGPGMSMGPRARVSAGQSSAVVLDERRSVGKAELNARRSPVNVHLA